jgi:hypothetical protein
MKVRGGGRRLFLLGVMVLVSLALLAPGAAAAANVVNGDFESGTLAGWQVHQATELGNWFAYKGTDPPISGKKLGGPIQAPPQGEFAAVTDEYNPDTVVLYQDVTLRPDYDHRLSLIAFYNSHKRMGSNQAIAVPSPDTLSVDDEVLGGQANQQYRIDVMRPEAAIESIDPADILRTLLQSKPGAPEELQPTRLTADLSAFAGQTVRIRVAVAAHEETFNAGIDAVAVESAPPGQLPPLGKKPGGGSRADLFSFGRAKANPKNGTATLPVRVSGPGLVKADGQGAPVATAGAAKGKKPARLIRPTRVRAKAKGTVKLQLKPTAAALAILREKHKLRVRVAVTFEPDGGKPETATVPVVLKLRTVPPRP